MRMLTRVINQYFLLLLLVSQAPLAEPVSEAQLGQELKAYRDLKELAVTFHQTKHLAEMNLDLRSEGRMALKRPDEVVWEIQKPSRVTVQINRKEISITSAGERQVLKISELSHDNAARGFGLLMPWLTLDTAALVAQYEITSGADHTFQFVPKQGNSTVVKMRAHLTPAGHLDKLQLFEKSGDTLEILFATPRIKR